MKTLFTLNSLTSIAVTVAIAGISLLSHGAEKPTQTRELLSSHDTIAIFSGITDHQCMGRTALCPDRCGHSGKLAVFNIAHYIDYKKPGKYGDAKAKTFKFMTEDNNGNVKIKATLLKQVKALKKDDLVHLMWNHDYVTTVSNNGKFTSKSPERPVCKVQKITIKEAKALQKAAAKAKKTPDLTVTGLVPASLGSFQGVAHVMVYEYDPRLADVAATLIVSKDIAVSHTKGTGTKIEATFPKIKTVERRRYYTVMNVYSDAAKTRRVMGTGEFGRIFGKGKGETRNLSLKPVEN
jgi:hypothetical protein